VRSVVYIVAVISLLGIACGDSEEDAEDATPANGSTVSAATVDEPTPTETFDVAAWETEIEGRLHVLESRVTEELRAHDGSASCLADVLVELHQVKEGEIGCVAADTDGDGEDEYVVRLFLVDPPVYPFGTVAVFDSDAEYQRVFRLRDLFQGKTVDGSLMFPPEPAIFGASDFNGDGNVEIAVTSHRCGAHTCSVGVWIVGYEDGRYVSLVTPPEEWPQGVIGLYEAENQITFRGANGDGQNELVLRQGGIRSAGAGPQREATMTLRWDGGRYALASTVYDPSDLRYFAVRDADDLFARGEYAAAAKLYIEAVNGSGQDVEHFGDATELRVYAQFRVGLAYVRLGWFREGSEAIDLAIGMSPTALHGMAASRFAGASGLRPDGMDGVSEGCVAVAQFARENLETFERAWEYGYGNPKTTPEAVCPF